MKKILFLSLIFLNFHAENSKPSKPPLTEAEATAMLQVAGGFLQILTNPNNQTTVTNGIGVMAAGMANLVFQLMKARGIDTQLSDEELQDLADQMAQMVNRGVEIEMTRSLQSQEIFKK